MKKTSALFGLAGTLLVTALGIDYFSNHPSSPTPPTLPDPTPPPPVAGGNASLSLGDVVRLEAATSQSKIAAGTPSELFVRFDLRASPSSARPPVALAVVLDRSGSMAGDKIQKTREAAKQLVSRLTSEDQVSVISYATDVTVDIPLTQATDTEKVRALRLIDQILDGGGTNLSGGLESGLAQLDARRGTEVRRLVLMSDGNANQGITDPRTLAQISAQARQRGITISTLGVGLDFNEDLMTQVAESAGGTYYYVKDAASMSEALAKELRDLESLAARQVEVGLDLAAGVQIQEIYGYTTELRGARVIIPVGDMTSGQKRQAVARITAPARSEGPVDLVRVTLAYAPPLGGSTRSFDGQLSVGATQNAAEVANSQRQDVLETSESIRAAKARQEAARQFADGKRDAAERSLRQQIQATRQKAAAFGSAALSSQANELESALQGIQSFDSSSEAGKDLVKREKARARDVYAY